jgi:hypothetical protein
MNWLARYHSKRAQFWPEVEAYFGSLPPELFRQGVLLRHNLATRYSDTGQFEDILSRPVDYPFLYFHLWLLEDWGIPATEARVNLERHVFLATLYKFCAAQTRLLTLDSDTNFDERYLGLEEAFHQRAKHHLAQLFPETAGFWKLYQGWWDEHMFPWTWAWEPIPPESLMGRLHRGHAFVQLSALAVTCCLGEPYAARFPDLLTLIDKLSAVTQIQMDTLNIRRDLQRSRWTYPIGYIMRAADIPFDQPVTPERVLGAMVLTGAMEKIGQECQALLEECRGLAEGLGLPTFVDNLAVLAEQVRDLSSLFSLKTPAFGTDRPRPSFAAPTDSLSEAITMAEGYLLADRTFRESWEVQRRGMFGLSKLVGSVFAPGLIVEALCQHREDMAPQVDSVFQTLANNGFRYYPHPAVPPDADDLGLALRLLRFSADQDTHRQLLQKPLRWMDANILASGQIPGWFTRGVEDLSTEASVLWGNHCATVEANLLLGLLDYDRAAYAGVIERAAARWLDRWCASGLGANTLYAPEYALWRVAELLAAIQGADLPGLVTPSGLGLSKTAARLADYSKAHASAVSTPQGAAFLTLICLSPHAAAEIRALFSPRWIDLLLKHQRYDGSWAGEPLFVTPTRGDVATWYASNSVTTAYCYHTLKTFSQASPVARSFRH